MSIPELAEYLQVSKSKLYRLVKAKQTTGFPALKVGRNWRVDLNQCQDWMLETLEKSDSRLTLRADGAFVKT